MKVLLMGDGSAYHANLATALRAMGHSVTVASDGTRWMNTARDIDLARRPGKLSGALLWLRLSKLEARHLKGYDVVQLSSPGFAPLRPSRLRKLLDRLKADNGIVCLSALGTDTNYVLANLATPPVLTYSEWQIGGKRTPWSFTEASEARLWLSDELKAYTEEFYGKIDGAVSALYEYHRVIQASHPELPLAYGGIPVVTQGLPQHRHSDGPIKILHAVHRGREAEKGADKLLEMLRSLEHDMPGQVLVDTPDNVPYNEFLPRLAGYDMVSDQLYSYTPATTALLAMAMGVVPISGGEDEFYDFIGEKQLRPIFNADPLDLDATLERLKNLIADRRQLARMAEEGRQFVTRHNEAGLVAQRFVDFWTSIL